MSEQDDPVSKAEELSVEIRLLYELAGSPPYSALIRQAAAQRPAISLTSQSLSDWINGVSVPSKASNFAFLIGRLQDLVRRKLPGQHLKSPARWEGLRVAAQAEKRTAQGKKESSRRSRKAPVPREGERRPRMAPTLDRAVGRPELEGLLLSALTADGATEVGLTTALQGAGGFGKTRLAMWVCHHAEIIERYPGGLLWVTLGQGIRDADLALRVNDICFVLSGQRPTVSSPEAAGAELGRLLDERDPVLLVIDDVWEETQLRPFRIGGHACSRLVTTRNADLLPTGTTRVHVDAMSTDQAERLISLGLAGLPPEHVAALARLAGRWPVLLNLINGVLRRRTERGQPPDEAAEETVRQLLEHGPEAFDLARPAERNQAVAATVGASLALLDPQDQQRYLDLAIVPEDVDVPVAVLDLLWPGRRADRLCEELVGLGLAADYRLDAPEARLVIHDVIRSYLRAQRDAGTRAEVHRRLVDAAAGSLLEPGDPTGWWNLPYEAAYLWRYLPYHLHEMGVDQDLVTLITDLRWVAAKTRRFESSVTVQADLAFVRTPLTEALREQLELSGPLLGPIDPPKALEATLASRLHDVPELSVILDPYLAGLAGPRLEPAWPLPDRPDPAHDPGPGHTGGVTNCAFSPDGSLLATVSDDGTARIWRVTDGTEVAVLVGHAGGLWGCAFSPDGTLLATSSTDRSTRLWRVSTGEQVIALRGHDDWVRSCVFSPDGTLLATTSADHTVRIWNLRDHTEQAVLTGHIDEVRGCVFSPDGTLLVSVSADHTVRIWSSRDHSVQAVLTGHTSGVWSCAFSPDGTLLATAGYGSVLLWNTEDRTHRAILTGHDEVDGCAFSPDGTLLATTSYGRVQLWNVSTGDNRANLVGHTGAVWGCAFSPDGALLATVSNDQTVRLWRVADSTEYAMLAAQNSKTNSCSFSPDGALLATTSYDSSVRLWRVPEGKERLALSGHASRVISCCFSPDGALLATTSYREVRLWRIGADAGFTPLTGHTDWVRSCAFSPDGTLLATGSADRTVRLWRVPDGAPHSELTAHSSGVRSCAFSPDGRLLATGTANGTVKLWKVADDSEHTELIGHTSGVQSCVFSPDGALLATASGDRTVRLWHVSDGTEHTVLAGHTSWADRCAFSPDGSLLATASNDQTIRLWDVVTGACHCALRVGGPLAWVAWHPSGAQLCTVGGAGIYLLDYLS